MKTAFSHEQEYVPTYKENQSLPETERLKYSITPMELGDFYDLFETVIAMGIAKDGKIDTDKLDPKVRRQFFMAATKYVPQYVKSIGAPLLDAKGGEISVATVANSGVFMPLAQELLWTLLALSSPSEADVKN